MKIKLLPILILALSLFAYSQTAVITRDDTKLRGTASESGKKVASLDKGATVEIVKESGSWFLVQATDFVGWIDGNSIRVIGTGSEINRSALPLVARPPERTPEPAYTPPPASTGHTYYRGSRGGCYYLNSKGNKTYVDRSLCN